MWSVACQLGVAHVECPLLRLPTVGTGSESGKTEAFGKTRGGWQGYFRSNDIWDHRGNLAVIRLRRRSGAAI